MATYLVFDFLNMSLVQAKGATSQFRTLDDLFDEAARKLTATDEAEKVPALKTKDILDFCSLSCISKSLKNICEVKGMLLSLFHLVFYVSTPPLEISDEIVVYRYSLAKANEYMRKKVAHLSGSKVLEESRTITRNLAKDGLMEDGQEELLARTSNFMLRFSASLKHTDLVGKTRACCDLVSQYLPSDLREALIKSYE